jgi:hypothetical protein
MKRARHSVRTALTDILQIFQANDHKENHRAGASDTSGDFVTSFGSV